MGTPTWPWLHQTQHAGLDIKDNIFRPSHPKKRRSLSLWRSGGVVDSKMALGFQTDTVLPWGLICKHWKTWWFKLLSDVIRSITLGNKIIWRWPNGELRRTEDQTKGFLNMLTRIEGVAYRSSRVAGAPGLFWLFPTCHYCHRPREEKIETMLTESLQPIYDLEWKEGDELDK